MIDYKYYTNNSIKATTGLVAAYNMIPISGQKIVDISGNGNDASRNGTPLSTKEGVKFSGANDEYYGASSISPSFDGGKQVSIAVRFKPDNVSGTNKYIVSIPESTVGNNGINIRQNNDDIITDLLQNGSSDSVEATAVLTTNKWYTAILTFDGSTQKLYVNGSLADSSDTAYALEAASDEINIGDFGTFDGAFEGEISDVRIYNRALSEQEVKDYHNSFIKTVVLERFEDNAVGDTKPVGWNNNGTGEYEVKELASQDSILKDLDVGTKYLECTSNGTNAFHSDVAYGIWEFSVYTGGNYAVTYLTCNSPTIDSEDGYKLTLYKTDGWISLIKEDDGVNNVFFETDNNYIEANTWYGIKITRTTDGEFTVYIKGGNFGDTYQLVDVTGGSGTNPTTDNTYTTSKYVVTDLDDGDAITNIKIKNGVKR